MGKEGRVAQKGAGCSSCVDELLAVFEDKEEDNEEDGDENDVFEVGAVVAGGEAAGRKAKEGTRTWVHRPGRGHVGAARTGRTYFMRPSFISTARRNINSPRRIIIQKARSSVLILLL